MPRPAAFIALILLVSAHQSLAFAQEQITKHDYHDADRGEDTPYLLYHPQASQGVSPTSLLIYLHGAGGSLSNYNLKREPYAELRQALAAHGYYVVVPGLGKRHFMNDDAKRALDGVVAEVLEQNDIDADRVHVMGTSMGGGAALAYALHRPDMIRSVCAVMPMTDVACWVQENPKYLPQVAEAYGGTVEECPEAYEANSAVLHADVLASIPILLIHGQADRTVLPAQSDRLADAIHEHGGQCAVLRVEGGGHRDEIVDTHQAEVFEMMQEATAP